MPKIKMPDGTVVAFPDDMPPAKIKALIATKFPDAVAGLQPQQQAPQPAAPTAQPPAADQPPPTNDAGIPGWMGDIVSGLNTLGDTASFGIAPAIQRGIYNAMSPGSGDQLQQKIDAVNQAHPAGVVAGTVASIPVDMALAAPLAEVAPAVPMLNSLVRGGGTAGNIARMVGAGAVMGGVNAATHGGDVGTGALIGAATGPAAAIIAKPVAYLAEKIITPTATKAWRYLANKLGENADDMVFHITDYVRRTGQQPSLQQIVSDHDAGVIAKFGQDYPAAGEALRAGAQTADAALPAQARAAIGDAQAALPAAPSLIAHVSPADATHAGLLNARDAAMDTAMDSIRPAKVVLAADLRDDALRALGTGRAVRALRERLSDGTTTLGDIDIIRRRLDKLAGGAVPNPDIADIADAVEQAARDQVPRYGRLMDKYAEASRYSDAFAHGASGAEAGAAQDAGLRAALATAEGDAGFRAGALSRTAAKAGGAPATASGVLGDISRPGTAQDAFRTAAGPAAAPVEDAAAALRQAGERARQTAPGSLKPQPDSSAAAANVITGLAEAPVAPISAARNISRGLYQALSGTHLSTAAQQRVAAGLTSTVPAIRDHAIRMLRIAGVSDARIKLIQGVIAANAARGATSYAGADNGR